MRRSLAGLIVLLALPASASAGTEAQLRGSLDRALRSAGPGSGALVVDLFDGRPLYARNADTPRIPASNEKLYTTAVALARFGPAGRLPTRVLGDGELEEDGVYRGNLYLRGGGDPTFGSDAFNRRAYGVGSSVTALARAVAAAGVTHVTGAVLGDETFFDGLRGGPDSGYAFSIYIGAPLSALAFNRGLANRQGSAIQRRPARYAAERLVRALRAEGVTVPRGAGERRAPAAASEVARVLSPSMATLARLTNVPSDNFFAEMLLKALGGRFGARGSTGGGAGAVMAYLREQGIGARIADGSGLSRRNRTTPRQVVRLLDHMDRTKELAVPFRGSLAVACRSGTLAGRMCGTRASGRCRGKTGTLRGVSALSGYCDVGGERVVAFSILMNGVDVGGARSLQNRMGAAIAAYVPSSASSPSSSSTSTSRR
ncbi:MAG TPA: D-alanyl-D-alanine carboxypeptidase/D-alanyl-D-alanine-endopeptidase [Solirubrobacteraceae bacterium]|nr:D-alanyl-D-alanine carboxypeptidase/D-alanyl-D-alanine-endopeptidase [Solirubrobacteraceae bacterium]